MDPLESQVVSTTYTLVQFFLSMRLDSCKQKEIVCCPDLCVLSCWVSFPNTNENMNSNY